MEIRSATGLIQGMEYRDESVRSLAGKVDKLLAGRRSTRSTIGHLRSGKRKTCSPEVAKAIAKVLDMPTDYLFVPRLSTVTRERGRAA